MMPPRLIRTLKTRVLGRPIHSQSAERAVGLGVKQQTPHAPHEKAQRFSGLVVGASRSR